MGQFSRASYMFTLLTLMVVCEIVLGEDNEKREAYVVYLGAVPPAPYGNALGEKNILLLGSVLQRGVRPENVLIQQYKKGFAGFAAKLTREEADALREKQAVVSVFIDPIYHPHTTRSWDFLDQTFVEIDSGRRRSKSDPHDGCSDTIVGLLDTGIWPESTSFADDGFSDAPSRWKGVCMNGTNFGAHNCNKKLIGARYYTGGEIGGGSPNAGSPRDESGHGTHTASTAAGNAIGGASYYGLAAGTAKGGSTSSRIAVYRVCSQTGCPGSAILAGFDDAVADGVDILSVSLGASYFHPDFTEDPIAIGAFHAVVKGITVVCSAGNNGPTAGSIVNVAPWILTVAASTIDRDFESDVLLGGSNNAVRGEAINFSNLTRSPIYPLTHGLLAKLNESTDDAEASHCEPDTLDSSKIMGKIVLCKHDPVMDTYKMIKTDYLKSKGAVGAILVNDLERVVASTYIDFPVAEITSQAASDIYNYISSSKNPTATITPTITESKYKPAPVIAYFSSRGPSQLTSNILKPDVSAPGVNILASWIPAPPTQVPAGQSASPFNIISGTSMSCPHVSGIAATVKAWNPDWSPAAIRSAIMTTAYQLNSEKAPITTDAGSTASPYDYGAGEVNPTGAMEPGLVYDLGADDYLQFLCNYGYDDSKIKLMISPVPEGFNCPAGSSKELISNLNYPSIAVSSFSKSTTVKRTLTLVGSQAEAVYAGSINSPGCLAVKVIPDRLRFTKNIRKLSFEVLFSALHANISGNLFGSITWTDGTHRVRTPFAVSTI